MSEKFVHDGAEYTLPSPNGLVFQSVAAAYQFHVRPERPLYDHGILIGKEKELVAEFGDMDAAPIHNQDTGEDYYQVRGHYFNSLEQARKKGWTDDERAMVEKKLLVFQKPADHWLHTKPPAGRPWPTYDDTAAAGVATLAAQLGLVSEALAYEKENKNRKTVIEALSVAQEGTEELAVV